MFTVLGYPSLRVAVNEEGRREVKMMGGSGLRPPYLACFREPLIA